MDPSAGLSNLTNQLQLSIFFTVFILLCVYEKNKKRALTEPRWADEIRRMVDTLFHWLQFGDGGGNRSAGNGSSVSPGGSDMSRPFNRLSNYFVTCGQWLPLPPESHVTIYPSIVVKIDDGLTPLSTYLLFVFMATHCKKMCAAGCDVDSQPNGSHRLRGLGTARI